MRARPLRARHPLAAAASVVAAVVAALVAATWLAAGCSVGEVDDQAGPPATAEAAPEVYLAVGASESVGLGADNPLREAWPKVLYRTAFDRTAVFVSAGIEGSTVEEALTQQLPLARELQPTVVTVWLNVNDLSSLVPVDTYEAQLKALVKGLRREGRTRVLVANTPPIQELPIYEGIAGDRFRSPAEIEALVAAYNAAIARVVAAEGAELVDLHAAAVEAIEDGEFEELIADDGFHPSTEGHARIAELFAAQL